MPPSCVHLKMGKTLSRVLRAFSTTVTGANPLTGGPGRGEGTDPSDQAQPCWGRCPALGAGGGWQRETCPWRGTLVPLVGSPPTPRAQRLTPSIRQDEDAPLLTGEPRARDGGQAQQGVLGVSVVSGTAEAEGPQTALLPAHAQARGRGARSARGSKARGLCLAPSAVQPAGSGCLLLAARQPCAVQSQVTGWTRQRALSGPLGGRCVPRCGLTPSLGP